jgi:flagellin-like hook-associated protein FlgL
MSQILNNIYDNITFALNLNAEAMARLQEQASTGARVNRPSDDPSAACNILQLNSQQRSLDTYTRRLDDLVSMLEFSTNVVSDITSQVTEAKKQIKELWLQRESTTFLSISSVWPTQKSWTNTSLAAATPIVLLMLLRGPTAK